ncbi:transferase [Leptospira tipperaryensis]|uniref:Transferase n=1 Tax=Leptospira tipperaryensis TaxID=2564040 RepID=A0A1D7UVQ6_9LEPT|nr:LIC12162 family protein [Leptospira tipperaryensis]AOP33695.1 transferase [Leptospira tipperaryensis]
MKRFLITTADERSWNQEESVLFLGEWCLRYDRRHVWSALNAEIAIPYGVDPNVKKQDLGYLRNLNEVFLEELTVFLNRLHGVSNSTRYWNLILGHWILRYLRILYNRYRTIEQVLDRYEISGTISLDYKEFDLAPNDSILFILNANENFWNHILNVEILKYFGLKEIVKKNEPAFLNKVIPLPSKQSAWKRILHYFIDQVVPLFSREKDAFIINSYLPFIYELKLQVGLKQIPQIWKSQKLSEWEIDPNLRKEFQIAVSGEQSFESFARNMIGRCLPLCYVEGFSELLQKSKKVNWPSKPRFIFTSNNFDTDELFKVWSAERVNEGVPYFVGQHGNNYGTLYGLEKLPELISTDGFVSWGWSYDEQKQLPAFVITKCNEENGIYDPSGGLLLIELPPPLRLGPEDVWQDFTQYFEEQLDFYESLPDDIRNMVIVRLHNSSKHFEWFDKERWKEKFPTVQIDPNHLKLQDLIAKSRLVVHSYDSTGILETLSLNIPTLCFWRNDLSHLVEEAIPYYERLKEVGIFHSSHASTAEFITSQWDSIEVWWQSEEVQSVRSLFCNRYARKVPNSISTLKKILVDASKKTINSVHP